jgi:UDP-perosamine 4-acetyltransferase
MQQEKEIYALGIGHNTPVFIDLAEACGYKIAGLYHYNDTRTGEIDHGFEIIGSFDDLFARESLEGMNFMLTMGDNEIRAEVLAKILALGGNVPSMIHPTAVVSRFATISPIGVYISPFVYVQADTVVNQNTILLSHVNISHTCTIGRNCFIAGSSTIGAYTSVEDNVFVGQGVMTISGKVETIGHHAFLAARSLITKSVPPHATAIGQPAQIKI